MRSTNISPHRPWDHGWGSADGAARRQCYGYGNGEADGEGKGKGRGSSNGSGLADGEDDGDGEGKGLASGRWQHDKMAMQEF